MVNKKSKSGKRTESFVIEATVSALGARGDGIVDLGTGEAAYVPFAAPGDRLRLRVGGRQGDGRAGRIAEILAPGPDRDTPACRHFGRCGGCSVQHLAADAIAGFKRDIVVRALARRGLEGAPVAATVTVPPGSRRRAEFAARGGRRAIVGLHARDDRRIVDLQECPVARPTVAALVEPLRGLLDGTGVLARGGDIRVTETDGGIDLLFLTRNEEPDAAARGRIAEFAEAHDVARVSWSAGGVAEPVALRHQPVLRMGSTVLEPPCAYFLQPTIEGETAIADIAAGALAGVGRIADLYAGCGGLSFRLARKANVAAFEIDDGMVRAIRRAAAGAPVTPERRDLARSPLTSAELSAYDGVVFDPPRAGARAQAEYLAASDVPTVVAVSCNPLTLGRDLRILVDGGYRIETVAPIDQFRWSAEVEAVAVLRRSDG